MSISATLVKELREKTNAGMMDCKRALEETKGNFDAAIEWLRVKGLSSAAKKADRVAAEGMVFATVFGGKTGVVVEVNSETDFVARNENFKNFVQSVAEHVAQSKATGELLDQPFLKNPAVKIGDYLKENIAKIGENMVIRRFEKFVLKGEGLVQSYVHGDGKIGVLIEMGSSVAGAESNEAFKALAMDLTLHIAAMNPMAITSDQIPAEVVSKEKEILKAKNIEAGKKVEMVDKIVEGQIRKFLAENCLVEQQFVKNPDQKIADLLKEVGKKISGEVTIRRFVRFELGAGIQKKQNDFAAEVAAQMKGH